MNRSHEPCLCGDTACRRCFPRGPLTAWGLGDLWASLAWDAQDDEAPPGALRARGADDARDWLTDNAEPLATIEGRDLATFDAWVAALSPDFLDAMARVAREQWAVRLAEWHAEQRAGEFPNALTP
jgi:hypothetical protein